MVRKSLRCVDGNEHPSAGIALGASRQPIWTISHRNNVKSKEVCAVLRLERKYFGFVEDTSRSNLTKNKTN